MAVAADGRVLRGHRNREAIVDGLLGLYRAGNLSPTTQQIAERAGVAPRSVYHHFADMEDLIGEVSARQLQALRPFLAAPMADGPLSTRVEALVAQRSELYETVAPVRRAALLFAHQSPTIRRNLSRLARQLRNQVETLFADELRAREAAVRTSLLEAIDVLTSWETWERLRTGQRLDPAGARRVLTTTLTPLLHQEKR
jgi:TetR/AcrR family transcriptional regulator, regulator of autoinduction and epiphytic fitness